MNDAVGFLDFARHPEEGCGLGKGSVTIEHLLPKHHVDEARFVFEREEGDAGCRARALAADHHADVLELFTMRTSTDLRGCGNSE